MSGFVSTSVPAPRRAGTIGKPPRNSDLNIPFPSRISPDVERARAANVEWLVSEKLLTADANVARYRGWNLAELAARFFPEATGDDLDLAIKVQTFFFFFDDLVDAYPGEDPAYAYAIADEVAMFARQIEGLTHLQSTFPLSAVFLDLWKESQKGMSKAWAARAGRNWENWLLSQVTESIDTASYSCLSLDEYMNRRRRSIGTESVVDLAERIGHFEVPPDVHESTVIRKMRYVTAEIVTLNNDLISLEKDKVNGQPNVILLLQRQRQISEDEAVEVLKEMVDERMTRFQTLTLEARRLCATLGLSLSECQAVERFVDAIRQLIRGDYDWSRSSGRYNKVGVEQSRQSSRIEDHISTTPYDRYPPLRNRRPAMATNNTDRSRDQSRPLLSTARYEPYLKKHVLGTG